MIIIESLNKIPIFGYRNIGLCEKIAHQTKKIFKKSDFQLTKKPLIQALHLVEQTVDVVCLAVESLTVKQENLANACSSELYATEKAYELVKQGMSFRDAYKQVGKEFL